MAALYLENRTIDAFALGSIVSFLVTCWLIVIVQRYIRETERRTLLPLEHVALVLTHNGDWFRLAQQCAWLVFWTVVLFQVRWPFWAYATLFAFMEHTIPVHSLIIVRYLGRELRRFNRHIPPRHGGD